MKWQLNEISVKFGVPTLPKFPCYILDQVWRLQAHLYFRLGATSSPQAALSSFLFTYFFVSLSENEEAWST
jgi:hypothetical protein